MSELWHWQDLIAVKFKVFVKIWHKLAGGQCHPSRLNAANGRITAEMLAEALALAVAKAG